MKSSNFILCISLIWLNLTDAKIGYFWHITDLHYDPFHNSPEFHRGCRHNRGNSEHSHRNGRHRDHTCDSSYSLIQSAAAFMAERHPDTLEFVLWTGILVGSGPTSFNHNRCSSSGVECNVLDRYTSSHADDAVRCGERRLDCGLRHRRARRQPQCVVLDVTGSRTLHSTPDGDHTLCLKLVGPFPTKILREDILSSTMEHTSEEFQLEAVRNVTDVLSRTFSSQFVFPALGHNDPSPSRRLMDMWMQWLPSDALQTFEESGFYTIEQSHSKLRIVVLNSVLWSGGGFRSEKSTHKAKAQWEWLEQVLSKARRKNEMVYLVAHAGPGVEERTTATTAAAVGGGELTPTANSRLLHVIRAFSDVIAGQFYGHRHADTFRLIYNEGRPVSWALLAPSVTPRGAGSISNPGLRLYKFESITGKVLDYTQYYLDVTNSRGEFHWTVEYNLTQYYGLRDVSAVSLDALAEKIRNHQDRGIFAKYLSSLRVRMTSDISDCDAACAHVHFCAITRADYHEFRSCVRNPASALASRAPHNSAAILLYAILILISS